MNVSQSKVRPLAFLAVVALAAVLISAVVAVDIDAARGGPGGGGKGGGGGSSATLTVAPNPAPAGTSTITISGVGFGANQTIGVGVVGFFSGEWVTTDSNGSFSVTITDSFGADTWYTVEAGTTTRKGAWVALASTTLTVCSTNPCQ